MFPRTRRRTILHALAALRMNPGSIYRSNMDPMIPMEPVVYDSCHEPAKNQLSKF